MAKPRLIIVIRHAQSEGNKNRDIHQTIPDHRVKLTQEGWAEANDAGRRLRKLLRPDDTIQFFTSPYRRTRETTEGIIATLTSDDPEPSSFRRHDIKVYEEPRLREQDFGNFQPCSDEMERMWQERADYGHFFYRIPNGESAADAYDRVSGFNESLWRQFGDHDFPSVCVLVTHGLMSRVFLMKWYHFTVEYFEDLRNIDHCEFLLMRKQDNGKYLLENKLRTWSELRRERAQASGKDDATDRSRAPALVVNRRWGGCPNGCNHTKHYSRRHDLESLRQRDDGERNPVLTIAGRRHRHARSRDASSDPTPAAPAIHVVASHDASTVRDDDDDDDDDDEAEGVISSPDGTPSFITASHRLKRPSRQLHVGRDFGGSYSGHNSVCGSSDDDDGGGGESGHPGTADGQLLEGGRHGHGLGDGDGDRDRDRGDGELAEREERSVRGSIY
ncbi:phosphoglycerate mutase family domain protein [Ophiocordyceps camponoti-floridani]|uniref:Phosphoglycerate mutase family domain protein n=1 Tax=Ophiocordyceps camponoti-floridani TaxID=2030778 RepID=A0A8H4VC28_9HYPO|nr:phosphoglycerate mutase family domain protein [Ophiocordyceps camponoti-floridani]